MRNPFGKRLRVLFTIIIILMLIIGCDVRPASEVQDEETPSVNEFCNPPVADAGGNQTPTDADDDGFETVPLDATGSSQDVVGYEWAEADTILGTDVTLIHSFSVGMHLVILTVINDCGSTDKDATYVNVIPDPNFMIKPLANAEENQTLTDVDDDGFETVTLDATGSSQDVVGYEWAEDDIILGTDATLTHSFSVGMHLVILTVINDCGSTDKDATYVNVMPDPNSIIIPVANAGGNQTLTDADDDGFETVTLDATGSSQDVVAYEWAEGDSVLGTDAILSHSFSVGMHLIILTVTNGCEATDKAAIYINIASPLTVCDQPVADAGENQTITDADDDGSETVTLNATGSSQDVVAYDWAEDNTILGTEATLSYNFSVGMHLAILTVSNDCGETDKSAVYINVASPPTVCAPPVADAGGNQTLTDADDDGFETVTLDATGSSQDVVVYEWAEGDSVLGTDATLTYSFSVGMHLIILTVTNNCGARDKAAIYINITSPPTICDPPVADAGENQTLTDADDDGFEIVTLDATGSSQDVAAYEWAEGDTILGTDATLTHSFSVGMHLVILTVTNDCGSIDKAAIYINVASPLTACDPPVADAGENQTLTDADDDGFETATLNATGSSQDVVAYEWAEDDTILGTDATLTHSFSVGMHLIILTVTNDCGSTDKDAVYINVASICDQPVADAGENQTITDADDDGFETVTLDATGSSQDVVAYEWAEDDTILGTDATLSYSFSVGMHLITLTVTNDCEATDKDAIYVNVLPDPNSISKPIADAGDDQTVLIIDASSVTLDGADSSDPEGRELTYLWTSIDENIEFIPNNKVASPKVSLPAPGSYYFVLIVDNGANYSEPDIVKITVAQPDAWVDSTLDKDYPDEFKFKTIQSAIDTISDGTDKIIVVINGPYTEKINVTTKTYLIGVTSQSDVVPQISSSVSDGEGVVSLYNSTTIENLNIYCEPDAGNATAKAAIRILGTNVEIKKCLIKENSFSDGIKIEEDSSAIITDILIEDVSGEGIEALSNSSFLIKNSKFLNTAGSAIWANYCFSAIVEDCIIYKTGWHGVDFSHCNTVRAEHCTIIDFSNNDSFQSGINICSDKGTVIIKSNLIEIRDLSTLTGINFDNYAGIIDFTYLYNYIYSKQQNPNYYNDDISIGTVDLSNHPNSANPATNDPLIINPASCNFSLDPNSPALGLGEDGTNPGAQGNILNP